MCVADVDRNKKNEKPNECIHMKRRNKAIDDKVEGWSEGSSLFVRAR